MNNNKKIKIYKMFFYVLLIFAIIILISIIYKYGGNQINENDTKKIVETFNEIDFPEDISFVENEKDAREVERELNFKGYKVIGIVKIPKM